MLTKINPLRRQRIKEHIRKTIRGTSERPRLVVYRSLKHIYAQLIDDAQQRTILATSTKTKDVIEQIQGLKGRKALAKVVGTAVAKKALDKNIKKVIFDRNGYLYHGVIKALADGAREGGLEF